MGRGLKVKDLVAIPASRFPSFEHRGHPVSSPEGCPAGGSLRFRARATWRTPVSSWVP